MLHLIDGTDEHFIQNYKIIRKEIEKYKTILAEKPELIVLNKIDALSQELVLKRQKMLEEATKQKVYLMSGVAHQGIQEILRALYLYIHEKKTQSTGQSDIPYDPINV